MASITMRAPAAVCSGLSSTTTSPFLLFRMTPVVFPVRSAMSPAFWARRLKNSYTAVSKSSPCRVERSASFRWAVIAASFSITSTWNCSLVFRWVSITSRRSRRIRDGAEPSSSKLDFTHFLAV